MSPTLQPIITLCVHVFVRVGVLNAQQAIDF